MLIYYSGSAGGAGDPEIVFGSEAHIMLTFWDQYNREKLTPRYRRVHKARRLGRPVRFQAKQKSREADDSLD